MAFVEGVRCRLTALLFVGALCASGNGMASPLSLAVDGPAVVKSGNPIVIGIALNNTSQEPISLEMIGREMAQFIVTRQDGRPPKETAAGRQWNCHEGQEDCKTSEAVRFYFVINPHESHKASAQVNVFYEMTSPGIYLVQAKQTVPDGKGIAVIYSNRLKVIVTE
jgi:hypothetical protein